MPYAESALNLMLDALDIDTVSLHSGDPGAAGTANEITGGGYARQPITHAAATAGARDSTNQPQFSVPALASVQYVGYWAGATFRGSKQVATENYTNAGTYTLSDSDLTLANV